MLLPSHEKVLYSKFQVSISKTLACRSWTPAAPGGAGRQAPPDNSHGSTYENFNYSKERLRAYGAAKGANLLPKLSLSVGFFHSVVTKTIISVCQDAIQVYGKGTHPQNVYPQNVDLLIKPLK